MRIPLIFWRRIRIWGAIMQRVDGAGIEREVAALEAAKRQWMAGGDAATDGNPLCTDTTGTEAQLRLLAQAGQVRQVCMRPDPPAQLATAPVFPTPSLPLLDEAQRPLFRRFLGPNPSHAHAQNIVTLMAKRGVMAHPFDWLPPKDADGFPAAYAALSAWVAGQAEGGDAIQALTPETWDTFAPAARRLAFASLRARDADAARTLLADHAKTVPADERTALVTLLAQGLTAADQVLLETLQSDRSSKVQTAARHLLARLGALAVDEDTKELADFLEVHKALLTRRVTIAPRKKLNRVQENRLLQLLLSVGVGQLAEALGLRTDALIAAWDMSGETYARALFETLVKTGTDADLRAFRQRMKAAKMIYCPDIFILKPRLTMGELEAELYDLVKSGAALELQLWPAILGPNMSERLAEAVLSSPEVTGQLTAALQAASTTDMDAHKQRMALSIAQNLLQILGLVLPATAARALHAKMTKAVFHSADPALDGLNFNIALRGPMT
jgi:hypothetical protein